MAAARFFVRGRVQGVWFRASTRDVATRLGLTGHARNLADGRVDVLAVEREALLPWLAEPLGLTAFLHEARDGQLLSF